MKETSIKNQILDYLALRNIFCWLTNTQGNFNQKTKSYYKNPRLLNGVSDIIGILPDGKLLAIEVKSNETKNKKGDFKNTLSEYQEDFLKRVSALNGVAFMARSIDDVDKFLIDYI